MKWKSPPHPGWLRASKGHVVNRLHRGQWVTSSWPRPRGKARSAAQQRAQDEFKLAAAVVKQRGPEEYFAAEALVRGTLYMPRDLMTQAAYGRLSILSMPDGSTLQGVRRVVPDAQLVLDQVSMTPGSLIFRSVNGWVIIEPPATSAEVLAWFDTTDSGIRWVPQSGGGGGSSPDYLPPLSTDFPTLVNAPTLTDSPLGLGLMGAAASSKLYGCVKAMTNVDQTHVFRAKASSFSWNYHAIGMLIGNSGSGKFIHAANSVYAPAGGYGQYFQAIEWNSSTALNAGLGVGLESDDAAMWGQVRYVASTHTVYFDVSMDGVNWYNVASDASFLGTPDLIGFAAGARSTVGPTMGSITYYKQTV